MSLFKENKNLDGYKEKLLVKYKKIGIAATKLGVGVGTMGGLFGGSQLALNCHVAIAKDLNIPLKTYLTHIKEVYKEEELNKSKKFAKLWYTC